MPPEENPKPPLQRGRAAGLEMLGLGLIAIGIMLALAALTGGTARQIAGGIGLILVLAGVLVKRRSQSLFWASSECCPKCGYDMGLNPKRCPQCGLERSQWQTLAPTEPGKGLVWFIAVSLAVTIVAGVIYVACGQIPAVRWTALVVLILGFMVTAFAVFSLPAPKA